MKKVKKIFFYCFLLVLGYLLFTATHIYQYSLKDETKKADAAIVLGTAVWGEVPSPVFEERIKHGIWLYQNGYVNYLIFTGGKSRGNTLSESEVAKQYALKKGIPDSAILLENKSTITFENFKYTQSILKSKQLEKTLVVSDPMHMKRAMTMAKDLKISAASSPTPTSKYRSIKSRMGFLIRETYLLSGYRFIRLFS